MSSWYEVQQFMSPYPDGSGGEWIMWEIFEYDLESVVDSKKSQVRLAARHKAIKSARDRTNNREIDTRVLHVDEIDAFFVER